MSPACGEEQLDTRLDIEFLKAWCKECGGQHTVDSDMMMAAQNGEIELRARTPEPMFVSYNLTFVIVRLSDR